MKFRAPSPALVVAFIALLVALSATAYAATTITKSSQIKNGIITSADLKNKTVAPADLSKSTLKRIDKSAAKAASTGAAVIEGFRKAGPLVAPANQLTKIASLTIPAGPYVISVKTTLIGELPTPQLLQPPVPPAATAVCKLDAAGDEDQADAAIVAGSRATPSTLYMQSARTLGGSATITLRCASSVAFSAGNTSIIAQRVGSTDKKPIGE